VEVSDKNLSLQVQIRSKLIGLSLAEAGIGTDLLVSGRLPSAPDEILAGPDTPEQDILVLGDHTLSVVGRLKSDAALFVRSYLVPRSASTNNLFPDNDSSVHPARLLRLTPEQIRDRYMLQQLVAPYPSPKYARIMPIARLTRGTYYLYLIGEAVFFLCGAGALIGLFHWLSFRVRPRWLAIPLQEMRQRNRLVWAVHLTYFGLIILGSVVSYECDSLQIGLLASVRAKLSGSEGLFGVAGRAYASGNVLRAATETFLVNYLWGSVVRISLPSVVLPGIGAVMATVPAFQTGLVLGPTFDLTPGGILSSSGTMLLEWEGYILAAFFSLLIPIFLFQKSLGGSVWSRLGRALRLNVQAIGLVALVLAVAAMYEASVVIGMLK